VRRMEAEGGRFVAAVVNWDEASGGMMGSAPVDMAFNRCLRLCGSSSIVEVGIGISSTSTCRACPWVVGSLSLGTSSAACDLDGGCSAMERKAAIKPFVTHPRSIELFAEK
jgi:hypothetical protein